VYTVLVQCLDEASLVCLTGTCKYLRTYRLCLWDLNRLLKRFVDDSIALRVQMKRHGAVISGGLALQFFARRVWKESDMDLFIKSGESAMALGRYFVEAEGYTPQLEVWPSRIWLAFFGRVGRCAWPVRVCR
jgi:hypothetical protein